MILKIVIIVGLFVLIMSMCLAIVGLIMMDEDEDCDKTCEIKKEFEREIEIANKDIDLMPEQEDYNRGYLGGVLCAYRIVFGKDYEKARKKNEDSN